jgi:thiol:disulfide interchange protein DsbA
VGAAAVAILRPRLGLCLERRAQPPALNERKNMSLRSGSAALLLQVLALLLPTAPAAAEGVAGTDYRVLEAPQPTSSPGKIEVIEFFSYGCPHCNAFYPLVSAWSAKLPADVVFRRVPVSFNRAPWVNVARAYFALQASGDLARLDGALFRAIHDEHLQLFDEQSLAEWVGKHGGDADKFAAAYTSFGVNNETVQADRQAEGYGIDSIPSLTVDGRFVALGKQGEPQDRYFAELLANTDWLIRKVRAESAANKPAAKRGSR